MASKQIRAGARHATSYRATSHHEVSDQGTSQQAPTASSVPTIRVRRCNKAPINPEGKFVIYWMTAFRRTRWNFALDRAIEWARELKKPLLIFEALRCDYPWASDRLHRFVLDGMREKARALAGSPVLYYPYVEPGIGAGKGLLAALGGEACVVVTDDFPCFFLPRMLESAARQLRIVLEAVDSNGLLPIRAVDRAFPTAFAFRRFLQKNLPQHFSHAPRPNPLARCVLPALRALPPKIASRWPAVRAAQLADSSFLASLPINHHVAPGGIEGGAAAAVKALKKFLRQRLGKYSEMRNQTDADATSGLSPYLHFGHISAHEIFHDLMQRENWSESKTALRASGSRSGWWCVGKNAEEFLDQLVTWRELGYQECAHNPNYDRYESLPAWALRTLADHARDDRLYVYSLKHFAAARTHDALWNAAQRQLAREGRIHNYLRMLWGKKILEWTSSPEEALEIMVELNNRYALDGRNPNSYSGIFWCLGRYDRPWGPERPVLGKVRYMSSENTARKIRVKEYLGTYAE